MERKGIILNRLVKRCTIILNLLEKCPIGMVILNILPLV